MSPASRPALEHLLRKQQVVGSNPTVGSTILYLNPSSTDTVHIPAGQVDTQIDTLISGRTLAKRAWAAAPGATSLLGSAATWPGMTSDERIVEATMFDARALNVGGRVFSMFVKGSLVVKLPRTRVESFVASGQGQPFDPGHLRVMKEWISLNPRTAHEWLSLAEEARDFVSGGR